MTDEEAMVIATLHGMKVVYDRSPCGGYCQPGLVYLDTRDRNYFKAVHAYRKYKGATGFKSLQECARAYCSHHCLELT